MRVRAAEAAVARTGPELASAEAALQFARGAFEREHEAQVRGGSNQQSLDRATLELRQAEETRRAAAFARDIAEYELAVTRAALTRAFDDSSAGADGASPVGAAPARFEVLSPIDGLVTRVFQESAGVVAPGQALLEVGDPRDLEVEVDVLSVDAVRIRQGASAVVARWGGVHDLECRVRTVEPSAFTKISALGVEEQRVNVILDFEGDPAHRAGLGDGFRVETSILLEAKGDVPLVPVGALFRIGRDWAVFVDENGTATARTVVLGLMGAETAEVLGGLRVGELVVLYPSDRVADGLRIRPRGGQREAESAVNSR
jgi:HlyD family secretion protein